jgi:PAS domain S-box-containing protein
MSRQQKINIPSAFLRHTSIISTVSLLLLGALWIGDDIYHFEQDSAAYRREFLDTQKREVRREVELFLALIEKRRAGLEDSLRRNIRDRVNEAWSVADNLHRLNAGKRNRAELEDMIREALRPIRYNNGRGYFFATGLDGVEQLFSDRPEFEGQNLLALEDPTGKPVIQDMIRIARERDADYYEYLWTKPGSPGRDHRKLAYIRHFPDMGWLIGTGEYLEDVEEDLKSEILEELERERFGDGGYLFAGTLDGIGLAGPAKGRDMIEIRDANERRTAQAIIDAARKGGDFVEYSMPPIQGITPHRKLSYVAPVTDWGWFVGAGVNMDLVERDIVRKRQDLMTNSLKHSGMLAGMLGIIYLAQFMMVRSATARLRNGLAVFMDFFRQAGESGAVLVPESQPYREMEELALTANAMVDGRLRAEKALQDSEARYRRLVDNALDAIFLSDRTGRILDANAQACRRLGYTYDELVAMSIWDVDVETSPEGFDHFMTMLNEKGSAVIQRTHRRKDGALFPVEIQITTFRENGSSLLLGVARDVSERLEAEERLRQSEATFVQLFHSSPEAIFLVHLEDERIREINEACLRLFGHSREDLLGRTALDAGLYARRSDREAVLADLQQGRPVFGFELQMLHRDGRVLDCVLSSQVLTIGGEPHALTSVHDVTERKKMQEMLIQSEKMISVGGIATGIAHEINNPLGIILQAAENLALRTRPDFPKNREAAETVGLDLALMDRYVKARKLDVFIQDIREAGIRAAFIVRNMLDFSRRGESRRTMCHLRQIVDKALNLAASDYDLKKRCDFRNIRIDIAEDLDVPAVFCSETEMEQVFLNLFRNAAQAMAAAVPAEGPRIAVRISAPARGQVRVEVEDNGPGIPADVQRRIFEPFFTTSKPGAGTGLGLAVSYFIVTSGHGGHIRVASAPGGGALFTVELPVQPGTTPDSTAG